ncbi:FecCD family ABC transporter permease [Embleya sp. NPDC001921]
MSTPSTRAPRRGHTKRHGRGPAFLIVLVAVAVVCSVALGTRTLTIPQVWHGLWSPTGTEGDVIVRSLRLPRTSLAVVTGVALGVAGVLMQGHTRNPIADPVLLGVSAGAGLFVVAGIFLLGITTLHGYVWFGFLGAMLAGMVVFVLGRSARGGTSPITLALGGAAAHALFGALTAAMLVLDERALDVYRFWTVGSVGGRPADITYDMLPFVAVGLLLAAANASTLNALSMGEDVARALGVRVGLGRLTGMLAITLLTGVAVAACGPIGFVGLMAAHIARARAGPDYRRMLVQAGLLGAILLLAADILGRLVARPGELPAGIMLAFVGAPVFIHLVRRRGSVRA